jgi:hypothetical protein
MVSLKLTGGYDDMTHTAIRVTVRFLLLLCIFSASSYADTFLCVGEAGAGVDEGIESKPYKRIAANIYDVRAQKYLLSNDSGSWTVKSIADEGFHLKCENEYVCQLPGDAVRSFTRSRKTGNFTLVKSVAVHNEAVLSTIVVKGRCTRY